ncbi:ETX/MTX2 family pore-forming toxin [Lactococcus ileimucosae]|uniref:ETX/MTX2 family pore-forming toxin n=1 Tax=Lactococcus ileimucosae TaxID=2941329 RepID=UPI002043F7C3|nr:ETX/MTX2 family pore-forming toxin [Lactococcus ileimucosae]
MKKTKMAMGLAGLTLIFGSNFASLETAYAESSQVMQQSGKVTNTSQKTNLREIQDMYTFLKKVSVGMSASMVEHGLLTLDHQITRYDVFSEPMNFSLGERYLFVNHDIKTEDGGDTSTNVTTFDNNSDSAIICSTPSFSYTSTDTTTSTSTMGVDTGIDSTANIEFPGVGSASVMLSVHFNFSTTKSQTNSTSINWTVPPENISLKPHHKIRVYWILRNVTATGTAAMRDRFTADIPYGVNVGSWGYTKLAYGLGSVIDNSAWITNDFWNTYVGDAREKWHSVAPGPGYPESSTADYDQDQATFTAKYGTEMYLRVDDITAGENKAKTVAVIPVPNTTRKVLGQHAG